MVPTLDIRADERKTQIRRRKENFLAWGDDSINSTPLLPSSVVSASPSNQVLQNSRSHKSKFFIILRFFTIFHKKSEISRDFYNFI